MNSIDVELVNLSTHHNYHFPNKPHFQRAPILKSDAQTKKSEQKKVQFKFRTSTQNIQPDDNKDDFRSTTDLTSQSVFDDQSYAASVSNGFRIE